MIKMKMMKKTAITLMLFVFTISVTSQESVLLRYNYKKGDKYQMSMTMKQDMGVLGGMNISMKSDVNIVSVENNKFELSTKANRVQMNVAQGGTEVSFDSDTKEEDLDAEGKKMKTQFDAVLKTITYYSLNDLGEMASVRSEPATPNIAENKDVIGYSVFPKEAVKVGSTWTQDLSPEGMKMSLKYKVKEITKANVIVDITGTIEVMGIKGSLTGAATIDRATGNTNKMKLNSIIDSQGIKVTMVAEVSIDKV